MLNIRLSRVGKRNHAQYKIVVAEKSAPVKGRFVEQVGSYDPHSKQIVLKKERVEHWLSQGVACSDTVYNLLVKEGVISGPKRKVFLKKKKKGEEGEGQEKETSTTEEKGKTEEPAGEETKEEKEQSEEKGDQEKTEDDAKVENKGDDKKAEENKEKESNKSEEK